MNTKSEPKYEVVEGSVEHALALAMNCDQIPDHIVVIPKDAKQGTQPEDFAIRDDAWVAEQMKRLNDVMYDKTDAYSPEEGATAFELTLMLNGELPIKPFKCKALLHLYVETFLNQLGPDGDKEQLAIFFKKNPYPAWMIPQQGE